ncbi:hypothetical protein B7486_63925, partial [cyanobacterium TDX16]
PGAGRGGGGGAGARHGSADTTVRTPTLPGAPARDLGHLTMDPSSPAAAVCLPVHRPRVRDLEAAVASAVAQEVPVEVVVSCDEVDEPVVRGAVASLQRSSPSHSPCRVVVQGPGLGMVAHWRAAVAASSAALVVVPGQDDVLRPAMLRRHLEQHRDHDVVLVASGAALVDDTGARVGPHRRRVHDRHAVLAGRGSRRFAHDELVRVVLRNGNVVGAPSQVTFRRGAYDAVGGFSDRYEHAADVDLWLRLATEGAAVLLAAELGTRRVHLGAATGAHRREGAAARDRGRLVADHGDCL